MSRLILPMLCCTVLTGFLFVRPAHAQVSEVDLGIFAISDILKLGEGDPREIVVRLINVALEFIGIITLVMILWGGFQFLFSMGNDEKMKQAGRTIRNAIIGLIIVLSSWAIVRFVLTEFTFATADEAPAAATTPSRPSAPPPDLPL
ncbi:hypothetical protein GF380_05615 [Candidatus Uhrbacteria bacterium]|nr:hypothetical protein [Candidatus Uhrbacteria bacterium]